MKDQDQLPLTHTELRDYFDITKGKKRRVRALSYFSARAGLCDVLFIRDTTNTQLQRVFFEAGGCHGMMHNWPYREKMMGLYTSLWCTDADLFKAACEYWDFLLDPNESPFKSVLKKIDRVYDEEGRPIAFGFIDLTISSQVSVGLMMQSRVPSEQPIKLKSWVYWKSKGFDNIEALYLSEMLHVQHDGSLLPITYEFHGCVFDPQRADINRMKRGTPAVHDGFVLQGAPEGKRPSYSPVITPWGAAKHHQVHALVKNDAKYDGVFKRQFCKIKNRDGVFKGGAMNAEDAANKLMQTRNEWSYTREAT